MVVYSHQNYADHNTLLSLSNVIQILNGLHDHIRF